MNKQICAEDGDIIEHCDLQAGGGWEHQRAVQYFQDSIYTREAFPSFRCQDGWEAFDKVRENAKLEGNYLVSMAPRHDYEQLRQHSAECEGRKDEIDENGAELDEELRVRIDTKDFKHLSLK